MFLKTAGGMILKNDNVGCAQGAARCIRDATYTSSLFLSRVA